MSHFKAKVCNLVRREMFEQVAEERDELRAKVKELEDRIFWYDHLYRRYYRAQQAGESPVLGDALVAWDLVTCVRIGGVLVPWSQRHKT